MQVDNCERFVSSSVPQEESAKQQQCRHGIFGRDAQAHQREE